MDTSFFGWVFIINRSTSLMIGGSKRMLVKKRQRDFSGSVALSALKRNAGCATVPGKNLDLSFATE
ncbi:MAG: hypothetical protein C4530_00815 [Desulfobacteraceae bacterium]|nr:MAG: hypothetical protein C4530_00815 [Desulfobacteraceae bacterium]